MSVRVWVLRDQYGTRAPLDAGVRAGWQAAGGRAPTNTLTLDVYGDYIPEQDGGAANNLPEPPASAKSADLPRNVLQLFRPEGELRMTHVFRN